MLLLLTACTPTFPCADDEWLDADGACHEVGGGARGGGADGDTDSGGGDSADTGGDPTDTADDTGGDSGSEPDPADDGWPVRFLAPWVDATAWPTVKIGEIPADNGIDHYTLGFIVVASADTCEATWGTYYGLETGPTTWENGSEYGLYDQIDTLRARGGRRDGVVRGRGEHTRGGRLPRRDPRGGRVRTRGPAPRAHAHRLRHRRKLGEPPGVDRIARAAPCGTAGCG
jgi:hypothetical protein